MSDEILAVPSGDYTIYHEVKPTGALRFVRRRNGLYYHNVLQQQWNIEERTIKGNGHARNEWRDVPLVDEEPSP